MQQVFQPGDVYFCTLPKFVQRPNTSDLNIDSRKVNAGPRPVVVLQQINSRRIIVSPISSDGVNNHDQFSSYIPIKAEKYPDFLKTDSFVKTNQSQIIDTKWLYKEDNPVRVGRLDDRDIDRVRQFSLYATQTEEAYSKWISEIVSKNVKNVNRPDLERRILQDLNNPERPLKQSPLKFERSDVVVCHFQPQIHNPSPERISGTHTAVILTDGKFGHIPSGQTIVVPLIENTNRNIHFTSALDVGVMVGDKPLRAAISQIQPMNRSWIDHRVGQVDKLQMIDLDRAVVNVLGLRQKVIEQSNILIQKHIQNKTKGR